MADYTFPTSYGVGTATVSNGSTTVTGQGTYWMSDDPKLSPLRAGDLFGTHVGVVVRIDEVVSDTELTLAHEWPGASQTAAPYEIQLTPRIVGAQEATRRLLISLANGNIEAFAALAGGSDLIPIFTGAGTMSTVVKRDLINGVNYDVQVDDLAGRAAYDGQGEGYAVLVSDTGDGSSALYTKRSSTSADWSDPAYITGATGAPGPYTNLIFAPVQTLAPGEDVSMTTDTSVPGQKTITLGIPAGVPGDMGGPNGGVLDGDYVVFDGPSGKLVKKASGAPGGQNDALFALEIADLKGERLGMSGGVADAFDDETGVLTKTNAIYDAANDLYSPSVNTTQAFAGPTFNGSNTGYTNYNHRMRISSGQISASGSRVRLTLRGVPSGVGAAITAMYIGHRSASGDAYDMDGTQVQVFVGASASFSVGVGATIVTDWIPFNLVSGKDVIVSFHTSSGDIYGKTVASATYDWWTKLGSSESGVSDVTGYSESSGFDFGLISAIEVETGVASMTLTSVSYTATAQPSSGRLALQVQGSETFAINGDLIGELSRDNGVTWAAASLALTSSFSGIRMLEATVVNLGAQPAGTSMKWRVRTGNSKNIRVSGVVAQWKV